MAIIAPSLLSADFARLHEVAELLNKSEADWFHLDIMDGVFVPNISFGLPIIQALRPLTQKVFDVHLMIVQPERYIDAFKSVGANVLSVHYEASTHLHRTVEAIKKSEMKAGVAINPHTSVDLLEDVLEICDVVCLMSVNPGFGGQKFIERTYKRVDRLKELIIKNNSSALIEIDGGVSLSNAGKLINVGADILVTGNTVFGSESPIEMISALKLLK